MLERLVGNDALKQDLTRALQAGRLPHAVLFVGEPGCGSGFAARCLAADYLYPQGGAHAEAVLRGEDSECLALRGSGASGLFKVSEVRDARTRIQSSALSTDARGRVMLLYGAQNMNSESANALLKIIEEPPEGVLFVFTATSAATVLPTIRSRCAAYTLTPVPAAECADALCRACPNLRRPEADRLAFLYEGHLGLCLRAAQEKKTAALLQTASDLLAQVARQDSYRTLHALYPYERDREGFLALLWQLCQLCSAVLRDPAFGTDLNGLKPALAAHTLQVAEETRCAVNTNANLRLTTAVFAAKLCSAPMQ